VNDDGTTTTHAVFVDTAPTSSWYLVVATDTAESSHVVQLVEDCEVVIGRTAATSTIAVDHEAVSRRHAIIRRRADRITIEDLGSRNRTLVNGVAIDAARRLTAGDVIAIGPMTALLATSSAARSSRQVATISELEDRLDTEVDRAHRYHRPLAIVMARFNGGADAITTHIERLSAHLRRMDVLSEYSGDEIAIVLPEAERGAAEVVAGRVMQAGGLKVTVGIAVFPSDGSSPGELISAARDRLRGAVGPRPAERVDINAVLGRNVVVADPQMKQLFELAKRVAVSNITVLIAGETGVGKEVVAEAIHRLSPRVTGPYVRLNCAALPESLVEAELFGYERGAFTGAVGTKVGFFESASGGTLFLDEIGELPVSMQAKLLRVLEHRTITRVGGTQEIAVDVRLICASNRDLELEVRRARFREDLFFRISGFVIPVPPLRDRRSEIPLLANQFVRDLAPEGSSIIIDERALAILASYDWPGNVRELRNVIERAIVMSGSGRIESSHLPEHVRERSTPGLAAMGHGALDVRQRVLVVEREAVEQALEANKGNQTHAARQLGVSRFALIRLMEKHDLKSRPPR
jgi:two-component system, NtrC family, response regulator AtoC